MTTGGANLAFSPANPSISSSLNISVKLHMLFISVLPVSNFIFPLPGRGVLHNSLQLAVPFAPEIFLTLSLLVTLIAISIHLSPTSYTKRKILTWHACNALKAGLIISAIAAIVGVVNHALHGKAFVSLGGYFYTSMFTQFVKLLILFTG